MLKGGHLYFFLALLSVLSVGCAIHPSDCHSGDINAGLVTKARCDFRGGYQANIEAKRKILANEQEMNILFHDVYAAIEKERGEVRGELRNQLTEYSALASALNKLLDELNAKSNGNKALEADVAALKLELENIQNQRDPIVLKKEAELETLRTHVVELKESIVF